MGSIAAPSARPGGYKAVWACTRILFVVGALIVGAFGDTAEAQCAIQAKPRPGDTGYRDRTYGCEGLYIQLQAATLNIQVISLVKNGLRLPTTDVAAACIHVPRTLPRLRDPVAVIGRGREANLNWALDGLAWPAVPMTWPLEPVIRQIGLGSSQIGVFGETRKESGLGGPVYIPVDVRPREGRCTDTANVGPAPAELVIRIPAAGSIKYRLDAGVWLDKRPYNGDGYFLIELPAPETVGLADVEIRWTPSGRWQFGAPESLSIFFW